MSEGISVIIPTLNRGVQIAVSASRFASVLGSTDELIIIDQTENPDIATQELYCQLLTDPRIHIWFSLIKSSGIARNTGALLAKNEILLFWDDDLEPLDDVLEVHRCYHEKIIQSQGMEIDIHKLTHKRRYVGVAGCYTGNYTVEPKGTDRAWNFAAGHVSMSRTVFLEVGGFNLNFIYPFIPEDYELHTRLVKHGYELFPGRDCRGFHAAVAGLSCGSIQTDNWYRGVIHNHIYSIFNTLRNRFWSISGWLSAIHLLYSLFRYMFPVRLFRFKNLRCLFFQEFRHGWHDFRLNPPIEVKISDGTLIEWSEFIQRITKN